MDLLGATHLFSAGLALGSGASVAVARKGTPRHRWTGRVYLVAMLVLNVTALFRYELTGRFNLFHFFALLSLATLLAGWVPARLKRAQWKPLHARFMMWSYAGLLAAAASEIATRLPLVRSWAGFGIAVATASLAVMAIAAVIIERSAHPLDAKPVSAEEEMK